MLAILIDAELAPSQARCFLRNFVKWTNTVLITRVSMDRIVFQIMFWKQNIVEVKADFTFHF